MKVKSSTGCVVIRKSDYQISEELGKILSDVFGNCVIYMDALTPLDLSRKEFNECKDVSKVECAIAASHRKARVLGSDRWDWTLVLEQDAIAIVAAAELKVELSAIITSYDRESPIVFHFFPEQFGLLKKKKDGKHYRAIKIPDYAVAYFLTKKAAFSLNLVNDGVLNTVADWPAVSKKLTWYATKNSLFIHPHDQNSESLSHTKKFRTERRKQSVTLTKHFSLLFLWRVLLLLARPFGNSYGENKIESEKLRTILI